ncbi:tetratricopeptide repeat protein [Streptomyces sp. NA02950]|uniref:AfsR/SARP family transcriptional regulator n=1 Tax=Streptomyces sp. NA02950 TaxID=2742137 RepID=UPI001591D174|nr:BTAD domain-containing putative transcriptional regulator [Streptomyces sp. NA02950]QKV93148.1 tetratricopeptide repeat protein [Streptomyces sp. NA02950]
MAGEKEQAQDQPLRFTVLGPVRAWRGEQQISTGSPQQRALLAALLLRGGRTATASELVDALWGDDPPDAAIAALRTYASRLRKAFAPHSDVLVSESGGYAVRAGVGALDTEVAERLATDAEKARHSGDRLQAHQLVTQALGLWDGESLANLPGPYAEAQRARLSEWQLVLTETRLDLDLELGHHTDVVSELTALTAAHPLRERLRELLMLALYRSGRQAEALAVYNDTRRLLAEDLGVDPCPELSELHQRILQADAELAAPPDGRAVTGPAFVRPAQLPATVADFTGRAAFVTELSDQLASADGRVMAVSAVAGIGGVGKTTLAVHVAHSARHHFPDGQLYVDLQGAGPVPAEPEAVLGAFLRALGLPESAIPDGVDERSALYRSTLDGRRVLTLLDNARDAAQVRPLLPGTEGCAALITSRTRMVDLESAHLVDLDVMSPDEALVLFTRIVGKDRVSSEREAAMDVVAACGFLPLAIRIAASRLASRRTWTVSTLALKLANERRRLDELRVGDLAVRATFELGYGQLEPEQAQAFRLLGLAEGPDISLAAAAVALDLDAFDAEELLESLVDTSLLESAAPGRYRYHDLVRLYARDCAERDQSAADREAALSRLLDFYLATAARVHAMERPGDRLVDHLSPTDHPGLAFPDQDAALDWLFTEADCLLACAQQAAHGETLRRAADVLLAAIDLAESGANAPRYEALAQVISHAAHEAGDTRAEGRSRVCLAKVRQLAGRLDEADAEAERALELGTAARDFVIVGRARTERGILAHLSRTRWDDAERHFLQAIEAYRAVDDRPGEASALCNLSRAYVEMDRIDSAIELARQGVQIYESQGRTLRVANGKYALGIALTGAGLLAPALEQLNEARELFREHRQPLWEGMAHQRLAEAHLALPSPAKAATHAEQALALRGIGGEWRRAVVLTLLGRALLELGQDGRAEACWREALSIHERLGTPEAEDVRGLLTPAATV